MDCSLKCELFEIKFILLKLNNYNYNNIKLNFCITFRKAYL